MRILVALLALFVVAISVEQVSPGLVGVVSVAEAAAPVISCTPSTTSGVAPLGVTYDCTGTTDADTTKPFHDLLYTVDFGDRSATAGQWTNGANTNLSKNYATGPVGGHVYETPGTYIINYNVTDGTSIARATSTITVTNPDTVYANTATICFFNSTVGSGCPAGATQTQTSDWDQYFNDNTCNTNKRCLFKRGDTFTSNVDAWYTGSGSTIGAYGSGAKPIVALGAASSGIFFNNAGVTDVRVMDLDCHGGSVDDGNQHCIFTNVAAAKVTVLRVTSSGTGGSGIAWTCTYCIIQDSTLSTHYNGYLVQFIMFSGAILGNSIGPGGGGTAEGTFRATQTQKTALSNNTVTQAGSSINRPVFRISAEPHVTNADDTFFVVASDNKVQQGLSGGFVFSIQCNCIGSDERSYDIIVERNWIRFGPIPGSGFSCYLLKNNATRATIRNNLLDMTTDCFDDMHGVHVLRDQISDPVPTDVNIYNNTFYAPGTQAYTGVFLTVDATNTIVKNNLCWFDTGTGATDCVPAGGTGTTKSNNSTLAQTTGTDPQFDTPLSAPIGFRINTASYAATAGTTLFPASVNDFFHCDDTTANERMGAFVPRTRAGCRGAAGP